jgi:hypothetical protein
MRSTHGRDAGLVWAARGFEAAGVPTPTQHAAVNDALRLRCSVMYGTPRNSERP